MWLEPKVISAYEELSLLSCLEHRDEVDKVTKSPFLIKKLQRLFWVVKFSILKPFLGNQPCLPFVSKWLEEENITNLSPNFETASPSFLDDRKRKINVINNVSTTILAELLRVCLKCHQVDASNLYDYYAAQCLEKWDTFGNLLEILNFTGAKSIIKDVFNPKLEGDTLIQFGYILSFYYFLKIVPCAQIIVENFYNIEINSGKKIGGSSKKDLETDPSYSSLLMTEEEKNLKIYTGRADSLIKLNQFEYAEFDCYTAILLDFEQTEGYNEMAKTLCVQSKNHEAHIICEYGLKWAYSVENYAEYKNIVLLKKTCLDACEVCSLSIDHKQKRIECFDVPDLVDSSSDSTELEEEEDSQDEQMDPTNKESSPLPSQVKSELPELISKPPSELSKNKVAKENGPQIKKEIKHSCPPKPEPVSKKVKKPPVIPQTKLPETSSLPNKVIEKKFQKVEELALQDEKDRKVDHFKCCISDGSLALLKNSALVAKQNYKEALDLVKSDTELYAMDQRDLILLKYSYAVACSNISSLEDAFGAISGFKEIIEDASQIFPAAYYRLALTYFNLNNFKEALICLKTLPMELSKDSTLFKSFKWPGTKRVIVESEFKHFTDSMKDLMTKCECPPPPLAVCCFIKCSSLQPLIYISDIDFKGFVTIRCTDRCSLQYHTTCWKCVKETSDKSDKEFLNTNCLTPDCYGSVIIVEIINKDGNIEKRFESEEKRTKKCTKQKKTKLEKKFEIKEMKKQKRQRCPSLSEGVDKTKEDLPGEIVGSLPNEPLLTPPLNSKVCDDMKFPSLESLSNAAAAKAASLEIPAVNEQSFYVIKKEAENKEVKLGKQKEKKKPKKPVLSVEEFCGDFSPKPDFTNYTEYQLRLHRLQESKRVVEEKDNSQSFRKKSNTVPFVPQLVEVAELSKNSLKTFNSKEEEGDPLKEKIYKHFEDLLKEKRTISIDQAQAEIDCNSDPEWRDYIKACGGLKAFMLQDIRFALVGDTLCFFSEMMTLYNSGDKLDDFDQVPFSDHSIDLNDSFDLSDHSVKDGSHHSLLNPNALEYSPTMNEKVEQNCADAIISRKTRTRSEKATKKSRNVAISAFQPQPAESQSPKPLVDVLSNLRKPLKFEGPSEGSAVFTKDPCHSNNEFSLDRFLDKLKGLKTALACKLPSKNILESLLDVTSMMDNTKNIKSIQENWEQICQVMTSTLPTLHKCIQSGTPAMDCSSKAVMKVDEELNAVSTQLQLMITKNKNLSEENEFLEQQLVASQNSEAQMQREFSTEAASFESRWKELQAQMEEKFNRLKTSNTHLENQVKLLQQKHADAVEKEMNTAKENAKLELKNAEFSNKIESLENNYFTNMQTQSSMMDKCTSIIKENQELMDKKTRDAITANARAKRAEIEFSKLKKLIFNQKIDSVIKEVLTRLQSCQRLLVQSGSNLVSNVSTGISNYSTELHNYLKYLTEKQDEISKHIDDVIKKIEDDVSTLDKEDLTIDMLRPMPDANHYFIPPPPMPSMNPYTSLPVPPPSISPPFMTPPILGYPMTYANSTNFMTKPIVDMAQYKNQYPLPATTQPSYNVFSAAIAPPPKMLPTHSTSLPASPPPPLVQEPVICVDKGFKALNLIAKETDIDKVPIKEPKTNDINPPKKDVEELPVKTERALSIEPPPLSDSSSEEEDANNNDDDNCSMSSHFSSVSNNDRCSAFACATSTYKDSYAMERAKFGGSYEHVASKNEHENSKVSLDPIHHSASQSSLDPTQQEKKKTLETKKNKLGLENLLEKLKTKYPKIPQIELVDYIKEFRTIKVRLTGLTVEHIVSGVSEHIERHLKLKQHSVPVIRPKGTLKSFAPPTQPELPKPAPKTPWGNVNNSNEANSSSWLGSNDTCCTICLEDMGPKDTRKFDCGHKFHTSCIKKWLDKTSNCPTCRVHLLLHEDYPKLK